MEKQHMSMFAFVVHSIPRPAAQIRCLKYKSEPQPQHKYKLEPQKQQQMKAADQIQIKPSNKI